MASIRKHGARLTLLLAGAALGTLAAWSIAHVFQLRAGRAELDRYAERLLKNAEGLSAEVKTTISAVLSDKLPFCSDQELAYMRKLVFNSSHIKDIGRNRDGKLYCTTGIGRLDSPPVLRSPDITIGDAHIFTNLPLLISPESRGLIVALHGASAVLNPESYNVLDQPPMMETGLLYDPFSRKAVHGFGHPMPLSTAQVTAQQLVERDGIVYEPRCSKITPVCIVAAVPLAGMFTRDNAHLVVFLTGGALLGGFFTLTLILFYHRQRSFDRRLRRAVREGKLTLLYQPVVNLETRMIVGAEALVRWTDEANESIPPDVFIPVAEEKNFVTEITRHVIRRGVDELGDLLRDDEFQMTINITAQDLSDEQFFLCLENEVSWAGISPSAVGLELTERSTADQTLATDAIIRLKAAGHAVYIDDFGTGYSSLAYLHDLNADAIKVDRAFTRTIGTEAVTASAVPQILDIANRLNLMVVVEGIETEEQAEYFRRSGDDILGQGWLFGRPVSAVEFKKLLETSQSLVGISN